MLHLFKQFAKHKVSSSNFRVIFIVVYAFLIASQFTHSDATLLCPLVNCKLLINLMILTLDWQTRSLAMRRARRFACSFGFLKTLRHVVARNHLYLAI